jgi:GH25 family lysozyme M1 (1,4-beta-N-acetylmuramidase)
MSRFIRTAATAALLAFAAIALTRPAVADVHQCPSGAIVKNSKRIDYCAAFKQFLSPKEATVDRLIEQSVDIDGSLKGKMRSYALIVSVSEYPQFESPADRQLTAVDKDYDDIVAFLKEQGFDEIIVLRNKDATPENINYFLDDYLFQNFSDHRNTARFLFAFDGHGIQGVVPSVHGALALSDTIGDGDPDPKHRYSLDDLGGRLRNLAAVAYETIALLGSCYSGGVFQPHDVGGQDFTYPPGPGAHAITAAKANELAWARQPDKGTVFFELLLHDVHTQHEVSKDFYPDGWFTSDENGATAPTSDGLIRLDRVVFDINQILQSTKNPNTGKSYPVVQIGELLPEQHYGGAFFFLENPQTAPPKVASAEPDARPAPAPGEETHARHFHHEKIAPQGRSKGLRPAPQVDSESVGENNPDAQPAQAPPPFAQTTQTTGSAVLHHPEIKIFKRPEFYPVRGVDLSQRNGDVAFPVLAKDGVRFAYLAATEGREKRDPLFEKSWAAARGASLLVGAYHFFSFCDSAKDQFANIARTVAVDDKALPLAIDVEWFGRAADPREQQCSDVARIRATLHDLADRIEQHYRKAPVLYAPPSSLGDLIDDSFLKYPIWLADFRKVDGAKTPTMKGKSPWTLWQFTDQATLPGVNKPADLNVFFGSQTEFDAFVRGAGNVALTAARGLPVGTSN